jgi:hypothetical protein
MNKPESKLHTPIYLKLRPDTVLPDEPAYYLLTRSGLFLCRNHEFFQSCAPATAWPSELAAHAASIRVAYPKLARRDFELVIGFFDVVAEQLGSEAAVLLAYDPQDKRVKLIVPEQCGLVGRGWKGYAYPISLDYEIPPLPAGWRLIGDIHSHVDMAAYASSLDKEDELHRPGLHIVVGRIYKEPPEFHIEVTVDGNRFRIDALEDVVAGYHRRRTKEVPPEWIDKVRTKCWQNGGYVYTYPDGHTQPEPRDNDDGKPTDAASVTPRADDNGDTPPVKQLPAATAMTADAPLPPPALPAEERRCPTCATLSEAPPVQPEPAP